MGAPRGGRLWQDLILFSNVLERRRWAAEEMASEGGSIFAPPIIQHCIPH